MSRKINYIDPSKAEKQKHSFKVTQVEKTMTSNNKSYQKKHEKHEIEVKIMINIFFKINLLFLSQRSKN